MPSYRTAFATVLKAIRRRGIRRSWEELFRAIAGRIPGVVLRTSLITGLPYEDEAAFEGCATFGRAELQRVGGLPTLPEEELRRPEC